MSTFILLSLLSYEVFLSPVKASEAPVLEYVISPCDAASGYWYDDTEINVSVCNYTVCFEQLLILWCAERNLTLSLETTGTNVSLIEQYDTLYMTKCLCPV